MPGWAMGRRWPGMVTSDSHTQEAEQLPLQRLFKLHPGETCSRMWESRGGQHGMRDALPPPGFVSSVPSMPSPPGHAGAQRALLPPEPGGSNGPTLPSSRSAALPARAAVSCCTHTTEGDTRCSACGFRAGERPDFQASTPVPSRGQKS